MKALLASLIALGVAGSAGAHTRSMSYSTWQLDEDGARIELRLKLLELTRQPPGYAWARVLPAELRLLSGGQACHADEALRLGRAPEGWAVFRWKVTCERGGPREIESTLLRGIAASHTHLLRIDAPEDDPQAGIRERVLVTNRDGPWPLDETPGEPAPSTLLSYIGLGTMHIGTGWDHLAFVLALLLLAASLREVAGLVTGFTLGHSLTLGLAVLGVVRPDAVAVEVLIGFSIALVAAENSWLIGRRSHAIPAAIAVALTLAAGLAVLGLGELGSTVWLGLALFSVCHFSLMRGTERPARLRSVIAFGFGLVHGFGFAGILMELELPPARLLLALFGFNVGVELGQLVVVFAAWPLLYWLSRMRAGAHRRVAELASAAIFGLGIFWLVSRNY
ncbi:MAG: HupE/UreJ family protein [Myxococcota bacterium]|nr:HupE/UreJ family protein [Myxococcota bacterium]